MIILIIRPYIKIVFIVFNDRFKIYILIFVGANYESTNYQYTWLVLDNNHLPVKPITEFIRYLNNVDKSPFTVRSYAYHLKLYWEFLELKQFDWVKINLSNLASFVGIWLLYETGLRIGQALALRHEDIICWDNEIRVKYRTNNLNQVRNKSCKPNTLHVSKQFICQLQETDKIIDNAKQNGWQRIIEMNTAVADNLKSIITTLENNHE